jgi:hypothetical protein
VILSPLHPPSITLMTLISLPLGPCVSPSRRTPSCPRR